MVIKKFNIFFSSKYLFIFFKQIVSAEIHSGNISPVSTDVCCSTTSSSSSTDEGIYQEVDDDDDQTINEEMIIIKNNNDKESGKYQTIKSEKISSSSSSSIPIPPPPPPPDFMNLSSATNSTKLQKENQQQQQQTRYIKNTNNGSNGRKTLIGKQQPLFIPPQFNGPPTNNSNIKPSEYLKRMATKSLSSSCSSNSSSSNSNKYGYINDVGFFTNNNNNNNNNSNMQRSSSENHLLANINRNEYDFINRDCIDSSDDRIESESVNNDIYSSETNDDDYYYETTNNDDNEEKSNMVHQNKLSSNNNQNQSNDLTGKTITGFSNPTYSTTTVTNDQLKNIKLKSTTTPVQNNNNNNNPQDQCKNDLIEELKMAKNLDGIKKVKQSHRNYNEVSFGFFALLIGFLFLPDNDDDGKQRKICLKHETLIF